MKATKRERKRLLKMYRKLHRAMEMWKHQKIPYITVASGVPKGVPK